MIWILLTVVLGVTALAAAVSFAIQRPAAGEVANIVAATVDLAAVVWLLGTVPARGETGLHNLVVLDPFAVWVMTCLAIVYLSSAVYARGYMRRRDLSPRRLSAFYGLFAVFALTMFLAPIQNNPGLYWIAIDLTTLVSAVLIGFERRHRAIEAAWKYLVIVSVGLSLALMGTVLFYFAGTFSRRNVYPMTWQSFSDIAPHADPALLLIAFLLILVGYGTKVGLAPMHTWLPDAHSEGATPVSAMLSGALLNCAMLGIVRYLAVMHTTAVYPEAATALAIAGVASLAVAALFITRQKGLKRLAAYSSIEHMGIIALGFAFGGPLGILGALYQMVNHSMTKSVVFFGAGNAIDAFASKNISGIRRVADRFPMMGGVWMASAIAITGAPPFGLFASELTIARAGIVGSNAWAVAVMAVMLVIIFIGFLNHFRRMFFGPRHSERVEQNRLRLPMSSVAPMAVLSAAVLVLGIWWPHPLWIYLSHIATALRGA